MSIASIAKVKYKLKHNPSFINDLYQKRKKYEANVENIRKAIELKCSLNEKIYRAQDIISILPND
jgi:hypothetical protein